MPWLHRLRLRLSGPRPPCDHPTQYWSHQVRQLGRSLRLLDLFRQRFRYLSAPRFHVRNLCLPTPPKHLDRQISPRARLLEYPKHLLRARLRPITLVYQHEEQRQKQKQ